MDVGTSDGRFVYRSARANPDKFYIGIDVQRKALEKVSELPHLTEGYVRSTLIPRYARAGFDVVDSSISSHAEWPHLETTWAKRLHDNSRRRLLFIVARATA